MKRLALLLVAVALLWPAAANAQLTMQMSNGWSFSFAGNVNAFWVFSADSTKASKTSSVRTGLLPAFATFDAKGKEAGMNLGVHFGFAPQIQNGGNQHDAQGPQIDMRQVYITVSGRWGQIVAGRELGLFSRQNILLDQTLFGVGAVGGAKGGGTTLGRIGYGYIYPNFNAQLTYSSKGGQPAQLSIGLFQPAVIGALYTVTKIPRVEAELTWHQTSGKNKYLAWAGGEWQSISTSDAGDSSKSVVGGTAGVKIEVEDLSVVVSGYIGKGIGSAFGMGNVGINDVVVSGQLRKSDGGYAQVGYTLNKKTTVAGSWGTSRQKGAGTTTADATDGPVSVTSMYTVGIYHQWTKSLKLVFEGSREINSKLKSGTFLNVIGVPTLNRTVVAGGFMLFY